MPYWLLNLLERHLRVRWQVDSGEVLVAILECTHASYHRRIIGRIAELRNVNRPSETLGVITSMAEGESQGR